MSLEDKIIELRRSGRYAAAKIRPAEGGFHLILRTDAQPEGEGQVLTDDEGNEVIFGNVAEARATAYHCGLKFEEMHEPDR